MKKTVKTAEISTASKVGKRISDQRKIRGLTRKQLAKSAGLKVGSIETTEAGRRLPTGEHILKLCEFFGVSPNWILTGADEYLAEGDRSQADLLTELTQLVVALGSMAAGKRETIKQIIFDLARRDIPEDKLPLFEKLISAGRLVSEATVQDMIEGTAIGEHAEKFADEVLESLGEEGSEKN